MFSAVNNSSNEAANRRWIGQGGKLIAISAIILSASAAIGFAGRYPAVAITNQSAYVERPCTQLELAAQMTSSECGTLTLATVVDRINALETDDHDE